MRSWKKIVHVNGDQQKTRVAILILDKIYFEIKVVIKEAITIINIYAPNTGAPQYIRQMLTSMKGEISNTTIRVGGFSTLLTSMDRSAKQKISQETQDLNDTMDQLDLIDIYRVFHPKIMDFTIFSSAYKTFYRTDHILGHKSRLCKLKFKKN